VAPAAWRGEENLHVGATGAGEGNVFGIIADAAAPAPTRAARRILQLAVLKCSAGTEPDRPVTDLCLGRPAGMHGGPRLGFQGLLTAFQRTERSHTGDNTHPLPMSVIFGTASAFQGDRRAAPPLGNPTRKVGPLAYSGRAVALPLTRTPMAGCSCRVGGPTFFLFHPHEESRESHFPGRPLTVPWSLR
jgi:hypothetical protein